MSLVLGILCIVVAMIVFVFADGLRRWYSGIFFAMIGTVMLVNFLRWRCGRGHSIQPPHPPKLPLLPHPGW